MSKIFKGKVGARIIDVRFAISGKTTRVTKKTGDSVKKGELLVSLDRNILQTQLDRELADFRKVRGDFEVFNQKNPNPTTEIDNYLKTQKQAQLDASVKMVEIAKARLDKSDLFSPIDGIVFDDSNLVSGINITPSSGSMEIIDVSSYFFEMEVEQEDIAYFKKQRNGKIDIKGIKESIKGKTGQVLSNGKKFTVKIPLKTEKGLLIGLNGEANFKK